MEDRETSRQLFQPRIESSSPRGVKDIEKNSAKDERFKIS